MKKPNKKVVKDFLYRIYVKLIRKHYLNCQILLLKVKNKLFNRKKITKKVDLIELNKAKIACILDEFSYNCFKHEADLHLLDANAYKEQLKSNDYHFFFMENTWRGANGQWKADLPQTKWKVEEIVRICRKKEIPTVFWNKDDPNHFRLFLPLASLFDYVFTTDLDMIDEYRRCLGHDRVYLLPFAAQPYLHNPIKEFERENKVFFAGTYYRHKYPERGAMLQNLLEASIPYGLDIFDRNLKREDARYFFPEKFQNYIRGGLSYVEITKTYKRYKVGLNVTTVEQSPTMFSRRVYELLASGTPVVSNYSVGIDNNFGSIVKMGRNVAEFSEHLKRLFSDEEYYRLTVVKGVRAVHSQHTYRHRLTQIMKVIGYNVDLKEPRIIVVSCAKNAEELRHIVNCFEIQDYPKKELWTLAGYFNDCNLPIINFKENITAANNVFYAFFNGRINYGKHYLQDLVIAAIYSRADAVCVNKSEAYTFGHEYTPAKGLIKGNLYKEGYRAEKVVQVYYVDSDQYDDP